jgi:hypothetical protein
MFPLRSSLRKPHEALQELTLSIGAMSFVHAKDDKTPRHRCLAPKAASMRVQKTAIMPLLGTARRLDVRIEFQGTHTRPTPPMMFMRAPFSSHLIQWSQRLLVVRTAW